MKSRDPTIGYFALVAAWTWLSALDRQTSTTPRHIGGKCLAEFTEIL